METPNLTPNPNRSPSFTHDPCGWAIWHLTNHPEMYRAFRAATDRLRERRPTARISADMILHVIRYNTLLSAADGDGFKVNNNLSSLYGRLYLRERPGALIETRSRCWLDNLPPAQAAQLDAAWNAARQEPVQLQERAG